VTAYLVLEFICTFTSAIVGQRALEDHGEARPFGGMDLAVPTSLQPLDLGNVGKVDLAVAVDDGPLQNTSTFSFEDFWCLCLDFWRAMANA
jgi:hypothetical protein